MKKDFRPYFLFWKTDEGVAFQFFDSLGELYSFIHSHSEINGYSVFRTLELFKF